MYLPVEEETYSLWKEAIKIVLNLVEFTVDMQDIAMIEISKRFLISETPHPIPGVLLRQSNSQHSDCHVTLTVWTPEAVKSSKTHPWRLLLSKTKPSHVAKQMIQ